jgi:hypothetical protein
MSWSVDMRCLYCDGKLPLYRKITHGQFCSTAHRKAYWLEQEQLAVERLHQTHNSLRAYRSPVPPEAILGPAESTTPVLSGFVAEVLVPRWSDVASMVVTDPCFETDCRPEGPALNVPALLSRNIDAPGLVALSETILPRDYSSRPLVADLGRADVALSVCWPLAWFDDGFEKMLVVPDAKPVQLVWTRSPAVATARPRIVTLSPLPSRMPRPTLHWPLAPFPPQPAPERLAEDDVPFSTRLFSLRHVEAQASAGEFLMASPVGIGASLETIRPALLMRSDPATNEVPFSTRLVSLRRGAAAVDARKVWMAPPVGIGSRVSMIRPTLPLRAGIAPVEDEVPFSNRLLSLPRLASQQIRMASPMGIGAPVEVLLTALLLRNDLAFAANEVPFSSRLLSLPRVRSSRAGMASAIGSGAPVEVIPPALLLPFDLAKDSARTLTGAGLLTLAMPEVPRPASAGVQGTLVVERRAGNLGGNQKGIPPETSRNAVATPPLHPQLKLAEGRRYAVEFRGSRMRSPLREPSSGIALPVDAVSLRRDLLQRGLSQPAIAVREDSVPEGSGLTAGLVPLEFHAEAAAPPAALAVSQLAGIPQPLCSGPVRPSSKLEPIDGKPFADAMQPEAPAPRFSGMGMPQPQEAPAPKVPLWAHAAGFWKHAPRDLKLLLFAIPALLALAFHPALPKVAIAAAPATGDLKRSIATAVNGKLADVRQVVNDRAAVALDEDFRSGLDDWASKGDATTQWSFDATGFVRPGPLALYRPSMGLTDYEVQFLGMIDQKAMSWVVRANDFNNYYVVKLVVLKPGPQTTVGITRYAVINGKAQDRVDTIVPIDARPDMLYRVQMEIHDDSFGLSIQGEMVDYWSEPRLKRGGIGFFTARGEESRVRWVQVTHQYDMLGRLCAYLAPYEIPTTNGSW